jgi:hypothetical protein
MTPKELQQIANASAAQLVEIINTDGAIKFAEKVSFILNTIEVKMQQDIQVNRGLNELIQEYGRTIDILCEELDNTEIALNAAQEMIDKLQKLSGPSLLHVN